MENLFPVHVDVEDDSNLWDIPFSSVIEFQSRLRGKFSAIQETCRSYCLEVPISADSVYQTALPSQNNIGEHYGALKRLPAEKTSEQEI